MNLFETPYLTPVDFSVWKWMKSKIHKRNVDMRDEMLVRLLDTTPLIKKLGNQFRQAKHCLRTGVTKCTEVDGWIFEMYCEL